MQEGDRVEESDAALRAGAADATLLLDGDLKVVSAIQADRGTIDHLPHQGFGRDILGEVHPDDLGALDRLLQLIACRGGTDFMTLRVLRPGGEWLEALFVATNCRDVPGIEALVVRVHILSDLDLDLDREIEVDSAAAAEDAAVANRRPIADIVPCGIDLRDPNGIVTFSNRWLRHRFAPGGGPADWTQFAADSKLCRRLVDATARGESVEENVTVRVDGVDRCFRVRAEPNRGAGGAVTGLVTTLVDITSEVRGRLKVEQSERLVTTTLDGLAQGVMILAGDSTISYANRAAHELVGVPLGSLVGNPLPEEVLERVSVADDLTQEPDQTPRELADGESAEVIGQIIRYSHPDGSERWSALSTTVIPALDDGMDSVVLVVDDITDRHEQTRLLAHQAMHDSLTGLPNRSAMLEFLTGALARQERRSDQVCGVLFCDLDGFKDVNDTLGHHTGDEVLLTVAHRIHKACRVADRVGRLGGDEFIVVVEGLRHPVETATVADRIVESVAEPIFVGGVEVRLGVSIGIALSYGDEDTEAVLNRADAALYEAKGAGRSTWRTQAWLDGTARPSRV